MRIWILIRGVRYTLPYCANALSNFWIMQPRNDFEGIEYNTWAWTRSFANILSCGSCRKSCLLCFPEICLPPHNRLLSLDTFRVVCFWNTSKRWKALHFRQSLNLPLKFLKGWTYLSEWVYHAFSKSENKLYNLKVEPWGIRLIKLLSTFGAMVSNNKEFVKCSKAIRPEREMIIKVSDIKV